MAYHAEPRRGNVNADDIIASVDVPDYFPAEWAEEALLAA